MSKTGQKELFVVMAAALALCLVALVAVRPAEAALPGKNGKIAYHRAFDTWTKNPSLSSPESKLLDDAAHLTYSPDGSRVAYMDDNEIYIANANGTGTPRQLTKDCLLDSAPAWSHDGTRIVFVRRSDNEDDGNPCDGAYNIWTMNADGTNQRQMTSEGGFASPSWSVPVLPGAPDGKILYKGSGKDFWTMYPDGTGKALIDYTCPTENGGVCDNAAGNPTFSPDGTEIAAEYFGDIFVIPSGGGAARMILPGPDGKYPGSEGNPAWSPDGTKIAFEHNGNVAGSQYGIYWAKADGSSTQAMQLTAKTGEVDPDWQPIPQCATTDGEPNSELAGTSGNDRIVGTSGKDVICGLGGNDTINGKNGNDVILGGPGADRLIGDVGNDTLDGQTGTDSVLFPGTRRVVASLKTEFAKGVGLDVLLGIENLSGSSANDRFTGNDAANLLSGLAGNDFLDVRDGIGGNDTVDGGTGASDTCRRDAGDTMVNCP